MVVRDHEHVAARMAENSFCDASEHHVGQAPGWVLADNDELRPAVLLLNDRLPGGVAMAYGGQHTVAASIVGVRQPEHPVLRIASALVAIRPDGSLRHLGVAKLPFVGGAEGMEELDPGRWVEGEAELDEPARCLREIDSDEQAAVGLARRASHDEYRALRLAKKAFDGLAQHPRARACCRRRSPNHEVGTPRVGQDVVDADGKLAG